MENSVRDTRMREPRVQQRRQPGPRRQRGLSLIEMLAALTVVAVLLGMGIPAFDSLVEDNRLVSNTNELVAAMHFARSEAIKRGTDVRICISNNGSVGASACSGGTDWAAGWNIRVVGAGGAVLRRHPPLGGNETLVELGNNARTGQLRFDRLGFTADGRTIISCDADKSDTTARGLIINAVGQVRSAGDTDNDNIVEDGAGNDIDCG